MHRTLAVLPFVLVGLVPGLLPEPAAAQELRMLAHDGVVREAPEPNSMVIATIPGGTSLRFEREQRAWYAIRLPASSGNSPRLGYVSTSDVEWVVECRPAELGTLEPGARFQDCAVAPRMIVVPAGSFTMGTPEAEAKAKPNEGAQKTVSIAAPFAVGRFEVTFDEWLACARGGGCADKYPDDDQFGRGTRPVINVSWMDAKRYVRWLSDITGRRYRLLSEAEWEYVARAGSTTAWYEGVQESEICRYANGYDQTGLATLNLTLRKKVWPCDDKYSNTAPVGSFLPNAFGLHDMLGNVWELTQDCWNPHHSGAPDDGSARETGECGIRVLRGGSWIDGRNTMQLGWRAPRHISVEYSTGGFRVARDVDRDL